MRLCLHIGTEKTGSTAIQAMLSTRREELAAHGFALPDFLDECNHRALACAFIRDEASDDFLRARALDAAGPRAAFRDNLLQTLADSVRRQAEQAHSYVLSSEHFHSRLSSLEEIRHFAGRVLPLFSEVRILCYLRRQDRMALSFYSQKLRDGFLPPSILPLQNIQRWAPRLPPFFDHEALLQRWSQGCEGALLQPRVYRRSAFPGRNVAADFLNWLGCPLPDSRGDVSANASLSSAGQAALLAFNRVYGGDLAGRTRSREMRGRLVEFLQARAGGAGRLPAQQEAREWLSAFDAANRRVARAWFARDCLFDSDLDEYPARATPPDWERGASLLAEFLAECGSAAGASP